MVDPVYPVTAQSSNVEGTVDVIIQVGSDGRVLSVMDGANSSGVNQDLIAAAKENARQWTWGPFPQRFQFPWYHNIRYVFRLQGKLTHFPVRPPIVRTRLPDEIEVIAIPCEKTYLDLKPEAPRP
jgi:TonB family protein